MRYRLCAHLWEVLARYQNFGQKWGWTKQLTYTHFGHTLEIAVGPVDEDNQIIGLGVRIR